MQYSECANIKPQLKGVILTKKEAIERVCFLDKNARERVCFWAESVLLDNNSWKYLALQAISSFSNFVHKRVHLGKICKENSMFLTKKLQEKGCLCF